MISPLRPLLIFLILAVIAPSCFGAEDSSPRGKVAGTWEEAFARMKPWNGRPLSANAPKMPNDSLDGKIMAGYQGWFATPEDGAGMGWIHYGGQTMGPGNVTFEAWPDMGEASPAEKQSTSFRRGDGTPATLFSSYNPDTVDRHFQWMKEYGVDGVFLQRFVAYLHNPQIYDFRTAVTDNVRNAANRHGRTWAMMYDLSGWKASEADYEMVVNDWKRLVDRMKITKDPAYQHHRGKPLVALWGVGFPERDYNHHIPRLVEFLQNDPVYGGNAVMLGTTFGWRDGTRDAKPSPELLELCARVDVVSPWAVGRYGSTQDFIQGLSKHQRPDLAWCKEKKVDYMPVIFPGFSWKNLMKSRNQNPGPVIPRGDGSFFWTQGAELIRAGARMIYVAMFDEVDEGTAIFKIDSNPPDSGDHWITNEKQPSDHYLWLTGQLGKTLREKTSPASTQPQRENRPSSETRHVLIIGIDGVRRDVLRQLMEAGGAPHLQKLATEGTAYWGMEAGGPAGTRQRQATWSGPGWSTILTGVYVDKHWVWNNRFENNRLQQYPHFFKYVREAHPKAWLGSVSSWSHINEHLLQPLKPVPSDLIFSPRSIISGANADLDVRNKTVQVLEQENPEILFVHLGAPDEAGHGSGYGPDRPAYLNAIKKCDGYAGDILAALAKRSNYPKESWLVIVITDHGGISNNHGGQSPEERRIFAIIRGAGFSAGKSNDTLLYQDVVVPTALKHLGVAIKPEWGLEGKPLN